jgi:hypothetical protein
LGASNADALVSGILILMPTPKLTNEILIAAIDGFESQKRRIDEQIAELRAMLRGSRTETASTPEVRPAKRRKISAAARKRMKEGQQRRWAKIRREAESPSETATTEPVKPKRRLSATGKANIVAALRKRWAAKKAAAVKASPAVAKKSALKKTAAKAAPVKKAAKKAAKKKAGKARATPETQPTA